MSDVWYYIKPYVLVGGGFLAAIFGGWFGVFAGALAAALGFSVLRMRGVI